MAAPEYRPQLATLASEAPGGGQWIHEIKYDGYRMILIDYLRNNRTNTSVAAFSARARTRLPVSVPLAWDALEPRRAPDRFTVRTLSRRLRALRADPWAAYWKATQRLRTTHVADGAAPRSRSRPAR